MKHLILLRHAKSSWVNPELDDFDRPINKRGKRSAKAIGDWMRESGWVPDLIFCSSARRSRETWELLGLDGECELRQDLYLASAEAMLEIIRKADRDGGSLLVIGHNPGIAELAHVLVAEPPDHPRFDDYPTGALLVADFDVKKYSKITPGTGTVQTFVTPHDLADAE